MMYLDKQLRWVTTQDPVNAEDIHRMLREGIIKMRNNGIEPKTIYLRPEVFNILKKESEKYLGESPEDSKWEYWGVSVEVKDLPGGQLALIDGQLALILPD